MDRADDDPSTFFHYMTLAASRLSREDDVPLLALSPEKLLNLPIYTAQFFRELFNRLEKPSILVLDNYNEIPADSVLHELINAGLEQVPWGLNAVVLSRPPPPPVMARLLVNKTMMTIQPEELCLTREEAIRIASLSERWRACPESISAVSEFTEGWRWT